jgi:hypothetical protein
MLSRMTMQASSIFEPKTRNVFIKSTKFQQLTKMLLTTMLGKVRWNDWYLPGVF